MYGKFIISYQLMYTYIRMSYKIDGMNRGFLTLVDGTKRYRRGDHYERMAKGLINSINLYGDNFPCALITDSDDTELLQMASKVIRPLEEYAGQNLQGTIHKLFLDKYTPFEETIFIEADCLLYCHPQQLWDLFTASKQDFVIQEQSLHKFIKGGSNFSITDLDRYLDKCGIESFPHTIGGLIYFKQSNSSNDIFDSVRDLYQRRDEFGLKQLSNQISVADETLFSTAMVKHKQSLMQSGSLLLQEEFRLMRGYRKLDVLDKDAPLIRKYPVPQTLVVHYSAKDKFSFIYLLELNKLKLHNKFSNKLILLLASILASIPTLLVLKKRWAEFIIKMMLSRYKQQGIMGLIPNRLKNSKS